jgi:hypothetical protein
VFFRAASLEEAVLVLKEIFAVDSAVLFSGEAWFEALKCMEFFGLLPADALTWSHVLTNTGLGLTLCVVLLTLLDIGEGRGGKLVERVSVCVFPVRWAFCLLLLAAILLYGSFEPSGFYYFQF